MLQNGGASTCPSVPHRPGLQTQRPGHLRAYPDHRIGAEPRPPLSIPGAALGTFLVAILTAELTLANVSAFWQQVALGAIILCELLFDRILSWTYSGR